MSTYNRFSNQSDNYFNIEDILASHEKIPCTTEQPLYRLGFLNPSNNETEHIMAGIKMELPYWLASGLCSKKRRIVGIDLPKSYKKGYREILSADANVVDLHKMGPYFYAFGSKLLSFEHQESEDISVTLLEAFIGRFRRIMDYSQNAYNQDTSKLTEKLDEMERCLFRAGQRSLNSFQEWESRRMTKITASEMVSNHRKRKRAVLDEGN